MSRLPLTIDLTNVVTKVTGKKVGMIFNDKRKTFKRRYKFCGVHGVTPAKIKTIRKTIEKKYPDLQFVVKNSEYPSLKKAKSQGRLGFYTGLMVTIF